MNGYGAACAAIVIVGTLVFYAWALVNLALIPFRAHRERREARARHEALVEEYWASWEED